MKRYIKLDEWEKHFDKMMTGCPLPKKTIAKVKQMWIDGMPTADVVEVVRCKDCKHYSVEGETTNFGWCGYWNKPTDEMRFCSDGERKEE